jgi:hypothetical protein
LEPTPIEIALDSRDLRPLKAAYRQFDHGPAPRMRVGTLKGGEDAVRQRPRQKGQIERGAQAD